MPSCRAYLAPIRSASPNGRRGSIDCWPRRSLRRGSAANPRGPAARSRSLTLLPLFEEPVSFVSLQQSDAYQIARNSGLDRGLVVELDHDGAFLDTVA
jgi:hypothetical protein